MSAQLPTRKQHTLARTFAIVAAVGGGITLAAGMASVPPTDSSLTTPPIHTAAWVDATTSAITIAGSVRAAGSLLPLRDVQIVVTVDGAALPTMNTTGADGKYAIRIGAVARGAVIELRFRKLGYQSVESRITANADTAEVNVELSVSTQMLSSVVVTGEVTAVERVRLPFTASTIVSSADASARETRAAPPGVVVGKVAGMAVAPPVANASGKAASGIGATLNGSRVRRESSDRSHPGTPRFDGNREQYDRIVDNPFLTVRDNALSTFSVDVDRASYGNVRRFLTQGQRPPADAVRIEELVNYFPYTLNEPRGRTPVAITTEVTAAPWQTRHQLVRIALQAKRIETERLPATNLVFLIDVSGSMSSPDKLPLVKSSMRLLVEQLRPQDRVAMVVYAGAAGLVLPSTSGEEKWRIMAAIDQLEAGGSTAGGAGLELAYKTAREHFIRGGNNRVILASDGDFNVGQSSDGAMERLIESKRSEGTYLTILGYGRGNYQDAKMEKMAKIGNGNYAYVDDLAEARKVLVHEMGATLVTVANDVKLQVEFNPARVASYRLIGYEDRLLQNEDFNDDKKDAGDMGAGHTVTALYEIVPVGVRGTVPVRTVDSLRYAPPSGDRVDVTDGFARMSDNARQRGAGADELLYVKLRYKIPGDATSQLISQSVKTSDITRRATDDFRFAAAVAEFGMVMRDSEYEGSATISDVIALAAGALGEDHGGYRFEFVQLVKRWREIDRGVAIHGGYDNR